MRTRQELGDLIGMRPRPAEMPLACIALRWTGAAPPAPLHDPATLTAAEGDVLLAARPFRTETEAMLWAEDTAEAAGAPVGLAAGGRDPLPSAERALRGAEMFRAGPVCPVLLSDALGAARRIADEEGILSHPQRRHRLLRHVAPRLGRVQLEHTAAHGEHVARTAARLAELMRLPAQTVEHVRLAGLLHDIGKLAFPEDLLAKRQGLSPRERAILGRHPLVGAAVARELGAPAEVEAGVALHHARFDAPATPPIAARLVCVADALATMTDRRPYSAARTLTEALAELRRGRGTLFDPGAVVAAHLLGASAMSLAA